MNNFVYDIPVKVYFGQNQLHHLGEELAKYGRRVLLTYGGGSIKRIGLYDEVMKQLNEGGFEVYELSGIEPNPRIESVREGAEMCKRYGIDVLLAVGGALLWTFAVGSASLRSLIIVGVKPCVSGDSGAWITPLIISVKWLVRDTIRLFSLSIESLFNATECLVSRSK